MSAEKLAMIDRHAQAERAAKACPHVDINNQTEPCPASQPELFVVPVRYALAEQPATHPCCVPGVETHSRPMAARRLRAGFLYLWQNQGPLQRYAVSPEGLLTAQALEDDDSSVQSGQLAGLHLKKIHDAWMLYSEYPLAAAQCQALSDSPAKRGKHMRHVALRMVANELQAAHCPPLAQASQVMAELIAQVYAQSMKADQRQGSVDTDALGAAVMKEPTDANIRAYTEAMHCARERERIIAQYPEVSDEPPGEWSTQPWEGQATQDWLDSAKAQAGGLFPVFACLDDDLGMLRDINHEQEWLEARHEQWMADNSLRLSIGGFVRSLVTEDGAELAQTLSYTYKGRNIHLTPEQGQTLLNAQRQLDEQLKAETRARQYGGQHSPAEAAVRDAQIANILAPVREFIPADLHTEAEYLVREYRAQKQANLNNHLLSAKVSQYIDLEAMNSWLEHTAPAHYQHIELRHKLLFSDRETFLPRNARGTWFVDYEHRPTRRWLEELTMGCLSAQCLRSQGAEQYAQYVRSADGSVLSQLFSAWVPSLDGGVTSSARLGEVLAALASENINATHEALNPLSAPILEDLAQMGRNLHSTWAVLVNRLAPALLLLKSDKGISPAWLGIFVTARLGRNIRFQAVTEGGRQVWRMLGAEANAFNQWLNTTAKAIGSGRVGDIMRSPAVANSGSTVAVAALLLNVLNAERYLSQAAALEGPGQKRINDTVSASLYAAAALTGVIDNVVRVGLKINTLSARLPNGRLGTASTLTLFGGVIGWLSAGAAYQEFRSLQIQLERAQTHIDPWLDMRQAVVGGQIAAFGTQALLGASYTLRALAGVLEVEVAILRYSTLMGPLNLLIAALGVLYLVSWLFEQKPLQNFLDHCCWSKGRAGNLAPIPPQAQQEELNRLYAILYTPRVSMRSHAATAPAVNSPSGMTYVSAIDALTIDLPGAEPQSVYLELSMIGDPVDSQASRHLIKNSPPHARYQPPRPWRDLTPHWLPSSACSWIPAKEGQGLRLSGPFNTVPNVLSTLPGTVSLRLRYRTPLLALLGASNFIGGERGVAFTLKDGVGVIALYDDPTPELDRVPSYPLANQQSGVTYLQPKDDT
ncbi:toxin VasX [Pseudomonas protegens]|uniref:toxin VasX n=1 Tax=Pseudomonas protegens TaxID=380021 RepID=UPI002936EB9B|nr:toxin VasX [Pseudomonas protegens]WOE76952.1 toxin VasX [Pseudomonas protegens]